LTLAAGTRQQVSFGTGDASKIIIVDACVEVLEARQRLKSGKRGCNECRNEHDFPVSDVRRATAPLAEVPYKEAVEALLRAGARGWEDDEIDDIDVEVDLPADDDRAYPGFYLIGPRLADLPFGLSKAPFCWQYFDKTYAMEFLGGFVGVAQDKGTLALRPEIGWAVRESQRQSR